MGAGRREETARMEAHAGWAMECGCIMGGYWSVFVGGRVSQSLSSVERSKVCRTIPSQSKEYSRHPSNTNSYMNEEDRTTLWYDSRPRSCSQDT